MREGSFGVGEGGRFRGGLWRGCGGGRVLGVCGRGGDWGGRQVEGGFGVCGRKGGVGEGGRGVLGCLWGRLSLWKRRGWGRWLREVLGFVEEAGVGGGFGGLWGKRGLVLVVEWGGGLGEKRGSFRLGK